MEFDQIIDSVCAVPPSTVNPGTCQTGGLTGTGGGVIPPAPPVDDDRCGDPAFYDANPDICTGYPRLILKPEVAICETGQTVQYRTFIRTGGDEIEVASGLDYKIASPAFAWIAAATGLATGVSAGTTQVSVTWQNLSAFAILEVVVSCAALENSFLLLFDDSKSMTQGFSSTFASKLSYGKDAARKFVDSTNLSKDSIAVAEFGQGGVLLQELSQDSAAIKAAIQGVVPSNDATNMDDGLKAAIDYLNANTSGTKIIILFTDGENNGVDPLPRAKAFKEAGNIIVVIGERCWGQYFDLLYKLASNGFFLSAYEDTENDVEETLDGLKSYLCSGSCSPLPGTYPVAQLNYDGFVNWDVGGAEGDYAVDLCGLGFAAPGKYDVWPGHGLYVDMSGSDNARLHTGTGSRLTSKVQFAFVAGKFYTFRIKIAGEGRNNGTETNKPIHITIGTYLDETITPTSWDMAFTLYEFTFVPISSTPENIVIEQIIASGVKDTSFGTWIDDVYLENTTDAVILLNDDFNGENPTTVDNMDSYGYVSYGCLETPPGAQNADPEPPPTISE